MRVEKQWIFTSILAIALVFSCSRRNFYRSENYTSYWNEYYAERAKDRSARVQNLSGKKICEALELCLRDCIEKYPSFSWTQYRGRRREITDFSTYSTISQCEIYCYQSISCDERKSSEKTDEMQDRIPDEKENRPASVE